MDLGMRLYVSQLGLRTAVLSAEASVLHRDHPSAAQGFTPSLKTNVSQFFWLALSKSHISCLTVSLRKNV